MDIKNLKSIKLEFGNNEQIEFVKKLEEKKEKNVIWTERAKYKTECPYCGNESDFCEDEDEAFEELTRILDNGDTVCDECDKKLSFGL